MTTVARPVIERLSLTAIRTDGGTQPRAQMDMVYVADLAQAIQDGANIPAIITYYDGADYWLADGFHRYNASQQLDRVTIDTEVRQGTRRDAVLCSVGANATHGLRRTNGDKRRAVETLLRDEEWVKWSDGDIARKCAVSVMTVGRIRQELISNNVIDSPVERFVQRNGTIYTMNAAKIGRTTSVFLPTFTEDDEDEEDSYSPRHDYAPIKIPIKDATIVKSPALAALQSSESNEWFTPAVYVDAARELMGGIDVDPASCEFANRTVQAATYYDITMNGLDREWRGRVWLNPPYGRDGGDSNQEIWSRRLIEQYDTGIVTEAVLLVNAVPGNKWFQPLWRFILCFPDHRIRFYSQETDASQPTHSNALIYLGEQHERFNALFSQFGVVVKRFRS